MLQTYCHLFITHMLHENRCCHHWIVLFVLIADLCGDNEDIILNKSTLPSVMLTSVYYPFMYPDDALCIWYITANVGSVIVFQFSLFDLEQRYDTITIGNGHTPSNLNSEIESFSGSLPNLTVSSKEHTAWMRFMTDSSVTRRGFVVNITQESNEGEW